MASSSSSSSSSPTRYLFFHHLLERLQRRNHDLTKKPFRLFRRNKIEDYSLNEEKKLHLVLDLDHTLLHAVSLSQLSQKEKYLIKQIDSKEDLWRFDYKGDDFLIKLRPFLREFLEEANKLFTMHVYTMACSGYAKIVLGLIDPDRSYFGDRVITRRESPNKKTLDLLCGVDQRKVVIVDDTFWVWGRHMRNLLWISKYIYFREEFNLKSYAEKKRDESGSERSLAKVLKFLKKLHKRFDEKVEDSNDMRLLVADTRKRCHMCRF